MQKKRPERVIGEGIFLGQVLLHTGKAVQHEHQIEEENYEDGVADIAQTELNGEGTAEGRESCYGHWGGFGGCLCMR